MLKVGDKVKVSEDSTLYPNDIGVLVGITGEGEHYVAFDRDSTWVYPLEALSKVDEPLNEIVIECVTYSTHDISRMIIDDIMTRVEIAEQSRPEYRVVQWGDRTGLNVERGNRDQAFQKLSQIADMLIEESKEMKAAVENECLLETLDGVTDIRFVLEQALESLRRLDVDVDGALHAVCTNNDLKVYDNYDEAWEVCSQLNARDGDFNNDVYSNESEGKLWYTVKNVVGKVMKRINFPRVDLLPFLPNQTSTRVAEVVEDDNRS